MGAAKYTIKGSDYIGVFASATDRYVFLGSELSEHAKKTIKETLGTDAIGLTVFGTELAGLFIRGNSNGIVITNLIEDHELEILKRHKLGINVEVLGSSLNAIGNNIMVNDKIAIINPDYDHTAVKQIRDAFGVETVKAEIGGFKTVGANNILTNKGCVINNRATDEQKRRLDELTGFDSVRTTANTGSLSIGISVAANSKGIVVGDSTTGFELARIMEGLDIND